MTSPNGLKPWDGDIYTFESFKNDIQDLCDIKFCDKDLKKRDCLGETATR